MDEKEEQDLRDELERVKRELSEVTRDFIAAKEDLLAMTDKAERLEQALKVIASSIYELGWTSSYAKQVLAAQEICEAAR